MIYAPARLDPRLERRSLRYRFDLERDVPWARAGEPGQHVGARLARALGVDLARLEAHGPAHELFQRAAGLEIAWAFSALERFLLDFVSAEAGALVPSRSLAWLVDEEEKHVALFDRYRAALEGEWREGAERLYGLIREYAPRLLDPRLDGSAEGAGAPRLSLPYVANAPTEASAPGSGDGSGPEGRPSAAFRHFFFWQKTLLFEEYTIWLAEQLGDEEPIQPLWRTLHELHRREELQHVVTDVAELEMLDLDPVDRRAASTAFWAHVSETFELFLGVAATKRLVVAEHPEVAAAFHAGPVAELPAFRALLEDRAFRHTRRVAPRPALLELAEAREAPGVRALLERAAERGGQLIYVDDAGAERTESYAELEARAARLVGGLDRALGERAQVAIAIDDPRTFFAVFWGAISAGAAPIPLVRPLGAAAGRRERARLRAILARVDGPLVVADEDVARVTAELPGLEVLGVGSLDGPRATPRPRRAPAAFVQFSSGSTGAPKGVLVSERALLANVQAIALHQGGRASDVFVSWLPRFHDMGLVGFHLVPLALGATQVHLPTARFLRRPEAWLEAMSRHRATVSAAPSSAYRLVLERCPEGIDLSSLRVLLDGAEPISAEVFARTRARLGELGLRPEALTPAYGLAETTLSATMKPAGAVAVVRAWSRAGLAAGVAREAEDGEPALRLVEVGCPVPGATLTVVDERGEALPAGRVGEIVIGGPSLASGYLGDLAKTRERFTPEGLRTADRGFYADGRWFVLGRVEELLCSLGKKYAATEIEAIVAALPEVDPARVAALPHPSGGVAVVARFRGDEARGAAAVRQALRRELGLELTAVESLGARRLLRTSSGKLARADLAAELFAGGEARPAAPRPDETDGVARVIAIWADVLGLDPAELSPTSSFRAVGGSSLAAARVHARLEDALGRALPAAALLDADTPAALWAAIAGRNAVRHSAIEPSRSGAEVAVIGIGLRLPGADTPAALADALRRREVQWGALPTERFDRAGLEARLSRPLAGAFLGDLFDFDPTLFGMSEAEGRLVDPAHRLFLDACLDALEDAGVGPGRVGVFAAQGEAATNFRSFLDVEPDRGPSAELGAWLDNATNHMMAARVARAFGLTGPVAGVSAACASSLVAIHTARRAILAGDADVAIAGGAEVLHTPTLWRLFSAAGVLSRSGQVRPYLEGGDGFVPGEGAVVVVLKRLDRARADGDRVLAVIRGSAVNNDGASGLKTAPSPAGQLDVMRRALAEAGVDPRSVEMIEGHGTATPIGDLVETRALGEVYGAGREAPAWIGSVKSNLGHLMSAAGALGFVKAVLSVAAGEVLPSAGEGAALELPAGLSLARRPERFRGRPRAAVHALGLGGTNCHVVLEAAPPVEPGSSPRAPLAIGGASPAAVRARAEELAAAIARRPDELSLFAAESRRRAAPHPFRAATVVEAADAPAKLRGLEPRRAGGAGGLVFLFPGPGTQHRGMAEGLVEGEPFAEIGRTLGLDLGASFQDPALDRGDIEPSQAAVFAYSLGALAWLEALGVRPAAVLGHSAGEYAALVAAGVLSPRAAAEVLRVRAEAMAAAPAGKMLAVIAGPERLPPLPEGVVIAADNGPAQSVLAGPAAAIDALSAELEAMGVAVRRLAIGCAAHSPAMRPAVPRLAAAAAGLACSPPTLRWYSTRTGAAATGLGSADLAEQLVGPVRFADAVRAALADGHRRFVELGATPALGPAVEAIAAEAGLEVEVLAFGRRGQAAHLELAAQLFAAGDAARWPAELGPALVAPARLGRHPRARRRLEMPLAEAQAARAPARGGLAGFDRALFVGHRIFGEPTAPLAWSIARLLEGDEHLAHVVARRPLPLDEAERVERVDGARIELVARDPSSRRLRVIVEAEAAPRSPPLGLLAPEGGREVEVDVLYRALAASGLEHQGALRVLRAVRIEGDAIVAELESATPDDVGLDPALVDGAFQALAARLVEADPGAGAYLGLGAGRVSRYGRVAGRVRAIARLRHVDVELVRADVELVSLEGRPLLSIEDFAARKVEPKRAIARVPGWRPIAAPSPVAPRLLVLGDLRRAGPLTAELARTGPALGPYPVAALPALGELGDAVDGVVWVEPSLDELLLLPELPGPCLVLSSARAVEAFGRTATAERPERPVATLAGAPTAAAIRALVGRSGAFAVDDAGALTARAFAPAPAPAASPPSSGVVWIVGGTGGLGGALAAELRRAGATVVVSGRRATGGPDFVPVDVERPETVSAAVRSIVAAHGRIDGVIYAAGVRSDRLLAHEDAPHRAAVLGPKRGLRHVLAALADVECSFVVGLSSLAAHLPSPGQSTYGAANGALEDLVLAHPGPSRSRVAIALGPLSGGGMLDAATVAALARRGVPSLSLEVAAREVVKWLTSDAGVVVVVAPGTAGVAEGEAAPVLARPAAPVLAGPAAARASNPEPAPRRAAPAMDPLEAIAAEVRRRVGERVRSSAASGAREESPRSRGPDGFDPAATFAELGVDSLTAVEIARSLSRSLGRPLPATLLLEHPTPAALARFLGPTPGASPTPPASRPVAGKGPRRWVLGEGGGLDLVAAPALSPGPGQVLVRVAAAGLNFIDVLAAAGLHPARPAPPFALGHEVAGVVEALGAGVTELSRGQPVFGLVRQGGLAEVVVGDAPFFRPIPAGRSPAEAAASLLTGLTAVLAVERLARIAPGERVLVQSAAGATGLQLVELLLAAGAEVVGTAGTEPKRRALEARGILALSSRDTSFAAELVRRFGPRPLDAVFDARLGEHFRPALELLRPGGRLVELGLGAAASTPPVDPGELFGRGVAVVGANLGLVLDDPAEFARLYARFAEHLAQGRLARVGHRYPLDRLADAIALVRGRDNLGKVVLEVGPA